jgi:carboxypeptidase PM20D1
MILDIIYIILAILILTSLFVVVRTFVYRRRHPPIEGVEGIPVDPQAVAEHLAAAVRCKTVPLDGNGTPDPEAFQQLHSFLEKTYPLVHSRLKREVVNGYSLLYIWEGSKPELDPAQMMAHQDVVSAEESEWSHPPFSGDIVDGIIWGRGTLDIKNQLIGIMEAAEALLKQGFQPERTLHFAFGHDEETGGVNGAKMVGNLLKERGVHLSAIVDEGGGIFADIVPGIKEPTALIGIGEKGYLTVEITAEAPGGHSSAPPTQTSIGILPHALARLEDHPLPPHVKTARPLYWALGPAVPFTLQVAWANEWLFGWFLTRYLSRNDETRAYVRTTAAITVFHAGSEDNTLPPEAKALVNFRMLPHYTIADVLKHLRKSIKDERVRYVPIEGKANEAVGPSPVQCPPYLGMSRAIRQIYGNVPEAPYVMEGGTDCGHYVAVCENIYRFTLLVMDPSFAGREHGVDECIPVSEMAKTVKFYARLMKMWGTESMQQVDKARA